MAMLVITPEGYLFKKVGLAMSHINFSPCARMRPLPGTQHLDADA